MLLRPCTRKSRLSLMVGNFLLKVIASKAFYYQQIILTEFIYCFINVNEIHLNRANNP
ncbi:Uncharacterised protein [Salmonella enterica subsp. salamae]|nr:Uncharacterised protein [Salmonella enterica subsp. salamae]